MDSKLPVVAAFDFDGTLTYRDTLLPFLLYVAGFWRMVGNFFLLVPALVAFAVGIISRQEVKERVLKRFFSGMPLAEIRKRGKEFALNGLKKKLKPEGMERLRWHQKQGDRCILISASLDVYLEPWAQSIGFNDVITSRLEGNTQGVITGKLKGSNCRGQEKVRRLQEVLGSQKGYLLHAYGDSRGDQELLELADFSYYRTFKGKV